MFAGPLGLIGIFAGAFPLLSAKMRIKKRLRLFTQQFSDALGMIASSLRAGHSLLAAFQMVAQEMPEPISQIFKIATDDISLGKDVREALEAMSQYMPDSQDLRFFITAVLIQREIGGNLAEILDSLNYTIRERFKLLGQIESQTAQAKLSGLVLGFAPAVIGGIIWTINPAYMMPLFKTMPGICSLIISGIQTIVGFIIIQKITNIRV